MSYKDLPSIDEFAEDLSNLPSIQDFITEENAEELPSVEDFIEKEEEILTEATQTIEDADGNTFAEVKDIISPWPELVKMVNDIRADIPDIPEIKYYDKELKDLTEQINQVRENIPEVRYYEAEIEAICDQIDLVKEVIEKNAADIPEIKYYDDQISILEQRLEQVNQNIEELPEPKYYEEDIQSLRIAVQEVQDQIPSFPKWVNEVNEVPDFSWIGKTFSVIDDDFIKVHDAVEGLRGKVEYDLDRIEEHFDKKEFETRTSFNEFREDLSSRFDSEKERSDSEKERIWKEIKETSMRMWGHHKEFKDDDRKLKKQILGEYNLLKKSLKEKIEGVNQESVKTDELLLNYFNELKKEISELPEVKYYDEQIDELNEGFKSLRTLVEEIKEKQEVLKEEVNSRPIQPDPSESNVDPLTPTDQNFATHEDLAKHYKLFINRVQQQLYTIGGGGAGFIKDLDDVDISGLQDGYVLKWNDATNKWKVGDGGGGGALVDLSDVDTSNLGDGRFLRYDATSEEFTFSPVSATNLELVAGDIQSGILTTTSTNTAVVMSISATTYRSVNYQVQVTRGTNYNMTSINVIHDGTTTYMSEYGTINQPVGVATFSSDISSGSLRLLGHPSSASETSFKVVFTALEA
jgi:prefoldin subunit 5